MPVSLSSPQTMPRMPIPETAALPIVNKPVFQAANPRDQLMYDISSALSGGDVNKRLAISGIRPEQMSPEALYLTYGPDIKNTQAFLDQSKSKAYETQLMDRLSDMRRLQESGPQSQAAQLQQIMPFLSANLQSTDLYGGATIDPSQQATSRASQQNLLNQLTSQSQGQGPSLAGMQLQQATNRNLSQQMAALAAARGGSSALAQRQASQQAALTGQEVAAQSAILRAQERLSAQQQLAGLSSQMRAQDIGLAQSQAALGQEAGLAGMNLRAQEAAQRAQLEQATRTTGYQGELQQAQARAQLQNDQLARNLQAQLQTQQASLAQEQFLRSQLQGGYQFGRQEQQKLTELALQQILQEKQMNTQFEQAMRGIAASKGPSNFFGDVTGGGLLSAAGDVGAGYLAGR